MAETRNRDAEHAAYLRQAKRVERLEDELEEVYGQLATAQAELAALRAEIPAIRAAGDLAADDDWPGIIYYMTWVGTPGNLVKIGFTRDLRVRVRDLTWRGQVPEVLAAEPAAKARHYSLETLRKHQFRHLRVTGDSGPRIGRTELFRRVAELDDHMAAVREAWPRWRWHCRLPDNAIGRHHARGEVSRIIDAGRERGEGGAEADI